MSEEKNLEFVKMGGDDKDEKGNYVEPEITVRPQYNLFDKVWFYLPDSLDIKGGTVIGLFLWMESMDDDSKKYYYYQVQYYKEMSDGRMKMFIGNVTEDSMSSNREDLEEEFKKVKEERIKQAIEQGELERQGAEANKKMHEEKIDAIDEEIGRLKKLQK